MAIKRDKIWTGGISMERGTQDPQGHAESYSGNDGSRENRNRQSIHKVVAFLCRAYFDCGYCGGVRYFASSCCVPCGYQS